MVDKENSFEMQAEGHQFGGFKTDLMKAITKADHSNLKKLNAGFPELVKEYCKFAGLDLIN